MMYGSPSSVIPAILSASTDKAEHVSEATMTMMKVRLRVGDWTTVKFGDQNVQAEVVHVSNGWILARVADPRVSNGFGYIMTRE